MVIFRENSENWTTKCWNYSFQFHFSTNTCCACYYEVMIVFIFFRNTAKYRISQKLTDSYCCVRNRYLYATVYVEKAENRHIFYKNGNILSKLIKLNYKMLKLFFPVSFLHEHILCVLLWSDDCLHYFPYYGEILNPTKPNTLFLLCKKQVFIRHGVR